MAAKKTKQDISKEAMFNKIMPSLKQADDEENEDDSFEIKVPEKPSGAEIAVKKWVAPKEKSHPVKNEEPEYVKEEPVYAEPMINENLSEPEPENADEAEEKQKKSTRSKSANKKTAENEDVNEEEKPKKSTRSKSATKKTAENEDVNEEDKPKKSTRSKSATKKTAENEDVNKEEKPKTPEPPRSAEKKSTETESESDTREEPKPVRRKRTSSKSRASESKKPETAESSTGEYKIININEELIKNRFDELFEKFNCCHCNECKCSVMALALNELPAKYISVKNGEYEKALKEADDSQVKAAIIKSVLKFMTNPAH